MRRAAFLGVFVMIALVQIGCASRPSIRLPGPTGDGRVRLPNGWSLSPAGAQIEVGELPLNMDLSPDGRHLIVTNNGTRTQDISIIDVPSWKVVQTVPIRASWLGIRFIDGGRRFLASGGNENRVFVYNLDDAGTARLADSIVIGRPWPDRKIWIGGLDLDERTQRLFVCGKQSDSLYVLDFPGKRVLKQIPLFGKPYTCLVSRSRRLVYVSLWGASAVSFLDPDSLRPIARIGVGQHPNDMVESPDGRRLFVANGNQNTVSVIDVEKQVVIETISSALHPWAPPGSTPNSVALSADGQRLYIANADNNCLAVMDVSQWGVSRSLGFIPVGWYPTCVRVFPGTGEILVANGKGLQSRANPGGPHPGLHTPKDQYSGSMFLGTVAKIAPPDEAELADDSRAVYANSPYTDTKRFWPEAPGAAANAIPHKVGDPSPIRHVFYIIKENRTYDQVFGDMPQGNGDRSLCLFPEAVTPNHHALASQFVLLDNLYADAEVSADGHNWSMGAYATDYVEKSWPTVYGDRGGGYDYEGGVPIAYPSQGYLWDDCANHGTSYRTYGEFCESGATLQDSTTTLVESLRGHFDPHYRAWDMDYPDTSRVREWIREFDAYEKNGDLPQFEVIKLPNDHTAGTSKGSPTPRAYVAQNDLALGMIIDRLSHSSYWKDSAVFVIEDDAQSGPDHVDAHRTVALAISPYTKRAFVDSELYSTSSMVRTIELILGLPPMSQFDAAATPMYDSFTATADLSAYTVRRPAVDLGERNLAGAYGQRRSEEMDFTREDATPERELNEIVWKSVRGVESQMPAPVRSAFVMARAPDRD